MVVRMNRLPDGARVPKERKKRAPVMRGAWRCCGVNGCGEVVEGTWASMERHLDGHGGGRADQVMEPD